MAQGLRRIFTAHDQEEARQEFQALAARLEGKKAERALDILEAGLEDAISVLALPEKYRRRLRTTNMMERLNEEIRRRERVIRIFPGDDSILRLVGALLAEWHEKWSTGKCYLNMEEYHEWRARQENEKPRKVVPLG